MDRNNEMELWWFAGQLIGLAKLIRDETVPNRVRDILRRELDDLLYNWAIGDKTCSRVEIKKP